MTDAEIHSSRADSCSQSAALAVGELKGQILEELVMFWEAFSELPGWARISLCVMAIVFVIVIVSAVFLTGKVMCEIREDSTQTCIATVKSTGPQGVILCYEDGYGEMVTKRYKTNKELSVGDEVSIIVYDNGKSIRMSEDI